MARCNISICVSAIVLLVVLTKVSLGVNQGTSPELDKCDDTIKDFVKLENDDTLKVQTKDKCIVYKNYYRREPETKDVICLFQGDRRRSEDSPVNGATAPNELLTVNGAVAKFNIDESISSKLLTDTKRTYKDLDLKNERVDLSYYLYCYESIKTGLLFYKNRFVLKMDLAKCDDSLWKYVKPEKMDNRHEIMVHHKSGCTKFTQYFYGLHAQDVRSL
ncbi:uncharacterized protein LOC128992635 isoform X2 [Macrosteles quadrilineatus]|uniref:uncharacterized protein LOC128992635 isoform X2 n=1 Tax=Macrosteles quadrilineatus TaxID=74068 RepID=UPI0023E28BF5|nr:uncharacterized protein LOC128992635 isoform X2 [Macrosteles quadrilineatus]